MTIGVSLDPRNTSCIGAAHSIIRCNRLSVREYESSLATRD